MTARRLGILVIDDMIDRVEPLSNDYVDLVICGGISKENNCGGKIRSLFEALSWVKYNNMLIDAVVFDINMSLDAKKVARESEKPLNAVEQLFTDPDTKRNAGLDDEQYPICPYGPLIALPFLPRASRFLQLRPISAFWKQPGVMENGLFLVSLSTLLSQRADNEAVMSPFYIQNILTQNEPSGRTKLFGGYGDYVEPHDFPSAINSAIKAVRSTILANYYIDNLPVIREALVCCDNNIQRGGSMDDDRLQPLEIGVNLVDGKGRDIDTILLTSLFADILEKEMEQDAVPRILQTINNWEKTGEMDNNYKYAEEAKKLIEGIPETASWHYRDKSVLKRLEPITSGCEESFCLRIRYYVNLMSWTKAWYLRNIYYVDEKNSALHYYNQLVEAESPQGNILQRLMYCGSSEAKRRDNLQSPSLLKPFWEWNGKPLSHVSNFKLDRISMSYTDKRLLISRTDLDMAKSYLNALRVMHKDQARAKESTQELEIPEYLR